MSNQIPQTSQQITRPTCTALKPDIKPRLGNETGKDEASFSGLLSNLNLDNEKQPKIIAEKKRHISGENTDGQSEITSEKINKEVGVDQNTSQKIELIALFINVASGEVKKAEIPNGTLAEKNSSKTPAKPQSKSHQVETIIQAVKNTQVDETSPNSRSLERLSGARAQVEPHSNEEVDKTANSLSKSEARLHKGTNVVAGNNHNGKMASTDLQGDQRKDRLENASGRSIESAQSFNTTGVKEKVAFASEGLQRKTEKRSSVEKQVHNMDSKTEFETVEIIESSKVKHYPADTEKHAWKQIGQKIIPNLSGADANQGSVGSDWKSNPETVSTNLSKTVKHLKIQLKPENLGTVQVKLTMNNGSLEVVISASDRHLAGRLQEHSDHLSRQLKAAGIMFENLSVRASETDPTFASRFANNSENNEAAQNSNEQKQSQANNKSFAQTRDQSSEKSDQGKQEHNPNDEKFQSVIPDANLSGNIFL